MRGSISSLQFVADWPSITATERVSVHPVLELQRNLTKGEKITMRVYGGGDPSKVGFLLFLRQTL